MSNLKNLKKDYELLRKKYSLPSFKDINEDFEIEVLYEIESEILLRRIRRVISENISSLLRTLEAFINPSNAPVFLFGIIKYLNEEDKQLIEKLYKKLSQVEIDIFGLNIEYEEEKEAKFIKDFFVLWKDMRKELRKLEQAMKKCYSSETKRQEKSYFG